MLSKYNVLFLCTGNSARSILAEALMNNLSLGGGRFRALPCWQSSEGERESVRARVVHQQHLSTDGLRSKSWNEFSAPRSATTGFCVTVCDQAAAEVCPYWPGQPMTAHWGVPDPAVGDWLR